MRYPFAVYYIIAQGPSTKLPPYSLRSRIGVYYIIFKIYSPLVAQDFPKKSGGGGRVHQNLHQNEFSENVFWLIHIVAYLQPS